MNSGLILLSILCFTAVNGENINVKLCEDSIKSCTVERVRLDPCPQAAQNLPCVAKRGEVSRLEFDFTGKEGETNLTTEAYWVTPLADVPLVGMDTVGCSHTTCPVGAETQTFKYELMMGKKFPLRSYNVKWKLWKEDGDMTCCFVFKLKLEK